MTESPSGTPRQKVLIFLFALVSAALLTNLGLPILVGATNTDPHLVSLCHATRSSSNPYNLITVDVASVLTSGHSGHVGAPFDPNVPADRWGDIIPPFDYGPGAQFLGMNWTPAGQDILANGCAAPTTTTTTPPGA